MSLFSFTTSIRRRIYLTLGWFDRIGHRKTPLAVLCYHSLNTDTWRFSIDVSEFEAQVTWLQQEFEIIDFKTFQDYLAGRVQLSRPSVLLTFDDGYQNVLTAVPFLAKLGIKPVMFALAETNQANRPELGSALPLMTPAHLKQLIKNGWEVGCHSATHADFWSLTPHEVDRQVQQAKKLLEKQIGHQVCAFAYPKGRYTPAILSMMKKASFSFGFTMDDGAVSPGLDTVRIPRIGVDRTHTLSEFKTLMSPSNIWFRKIIKNSPIGRYIQ